MAEESVNTWVISKVTNNPSVTQETSSHLVATQQASDSDGGLVFSKTKKVCMF